MEDPQLTGQPACCIDWQGTKSPISRWRGRTDIAHPHMHTSTHARKTQHKQATASAFPCSATIIWCSKTALCWCENLTTSLSICTRLAWCRGSRLSVQLRPKQVCKWNQLLSQTAADRSVGPMTIQTLYYYPLHSWSAGRLQREVRLEDTGTQPTAK